MKILKTILVFSVLTIFMYCSKNSGSFDVATEIAADGQGGPSITPDSENLASSSTTDSTQFSASGTDVEVVDEKKTEASENDTEGNDGSAENSDDKNQVEQEGRKKLKTIQLPATLTPMMTNLKFQQTIIQKMKMRLLSLKTKRKRRKRI